MNISEKCFHTQYFNEKRRVEWAFPISWEPGVRTWTPWCDVLIYMYTCASCYMINFQAEADHEKAIIKIVNTSKVYFRCFFNLQNLVFKIEMYKYIRYIHAHWRSYFSWWNKNNVSNVNKHYRDMFMEYNNQRNNLHF